MAPLATRDGSPCSGLTSPTPYQIALSISLGILLLAIVLLAWTYHRYRTVLCSNVLLSQLAIRVKDTLHWRDETLWQRDEEIRALKRSLEALSDHLMVLTGDEGSKFVIGEGSDVESDAGEEEEEECAEALAEGLQRGDGKWVVREEEAVVGRVVNAGAASVVGAEKKGKN